MIKLLHVLSALDGGGVERMLFNYYSLMDKNEFHFDFIVHGDKTGILEKPLSEMDCKIFHVTPKKESAVKNYFEIKKVMRGAGYDAVVVHQSYSSFFALTAAHLCGIKTGIIHSHRCISEEKVTAKKRLFRMLNKAFATDYAACSKEAGEWLFGYGASVHIVYNTVDSALFAFDAGIRAENRKQLGLADNEICLLQVGRFSDEKNQIFSIELLCALPDKKYKLVFAGDGDTMPGIRAAAAEKGVEGRVIFAGCVENAAGLMNAADILLLPSKNEGFGLAAVEAQMCGLAVLASEAVSRSTKISDKISYLPISGTEKWVAAVKACACGERQSASDDRFSAQKQAPAYSEWLRSIITKKAD